MKRPLNSRQILSVLTLSAVGLFLLLLVTAGFFPGSASLVLTLILISLIPILAIAMVLSFMWGKTTLASKQLSAHGRHARIYATATVVSAILSVLFTIASAHEPIFKPGTRHFIYENIGVCLLFTAFVAAVSLINLQRFVYWPFWSKADRANADERQKFVRQRVFEKAYRYALLLLLAAAWIYAEHVSRMNKFLPWVLVLALTSLPSVIAAWQKDS